jgi:hypothetical protein
MRKTLSTRVEESRLTDHPKLNTPHGHGTQGAFTLKLKSSGVNCYVIVDDARDWDDGQLARPRWEHVSVHCDGRCPTWEEMQEVKGLFWEDHEVVIQIHPDRKHYVNSHPHTLHMWRVIDDYQPVPPKCCV